MPTSLRAMPVLILASLGGCAGGGGAEGSAEVVGGSTGRYQAGEGTRPAQLCLIERAGGPGSFGLVAWGRGDANCALSGTFRREGSRLRLLPDGDEACALGAQVAAGRITLDGGLGADCARYYCGPGATFEGAAFALAGAGVEEARQVADLVGDPLCRD